MLSLVFNLKQELPKLDHLKITDLCVRSESGRTYQDGCLAVRGNNMAFKLSAHAVERLCLVYSGPLSHHLGRKTMQLRFRFVLVGRQSGS
ncbi:uncharacterized protein BKA55DRAFT_577153 [Fusarium redolens]|uniref:Uncharacterized protein n=1 Tax=Fusarium redolens TaxID=48865 RepID=A0A9P9GJQ9_FUSRE|nr:uncharacterized protein BKA55DRAFT_577153 [Fusarium redolens]KAH7240186.1 hypothetical protein BKA55DRAFT_577153 [Fusarium redolens]